VEESYTLNLFGALWSACKGLVYVYATYMLRMHPMDMCLWSIDTYWQSVLSQTWCTCSCNHCRSKINCVDHIWATFRVPPSLCMECRSLLDNACCQGLLSPLVISLCLLLRKSKEFLTHIRANKPTSWLLFCNQPCRSTPTGEPRTRGSWALPLAASIRWDAR
jgi:hypothetical protein